MKYAFAGDREISVKVLNFMMEQGFKPSFLIIGNNDKSSHNQTLIKISGLEPSKIIVANELNSNNAIDKLSSVDLDYIIGIHFPYIIKKPILDIPKVGTLNLHPAYLPFNKGWHTPSWAILDDTPYGATLHFMSEELDKGDIIHQEKIEVTSYDTADSLYQKVMDLEYEVFKNSWEDIISCNPRRVKQKDNGTQHSKKDLKKIAEIDLNSEMNAKKFIDKLRALTTNDLHESAYYIENGVKHYIQINITKDI